ncbi:MAG: HD domain-containing phosphohydrolase [Pseudomonadota bacterium]
MMQANKNVDVFSRLLFVDDEKSILNALKRLFRDPNYEITVTDSSVKAMNMIESHPFDVIISDMRMPEIDGAMLLSHAASIQPNSIRILLTGYADINATIKAINDGNIYKYIAKPWKNDEIIKTVQEAVESKKSIDTQKFQQTSLENRFSKLKQANLLLNKKIKNKQQEIEQSISFLDAAKEELSHTCDTTLKTFASTINQSINYTPKQYTDIKKYLRLINEELKLSNYDKALLDQAALLFQIGKIKCDPRLNQSHQNNSSNSKIKSRDYPVYSEKMLMPFENMADLRRVIRHHLENFDGSGHPDQLEGKEIPLLSRILRIVADFNHFISIQKNSFEGSIEKLLSQSSFKYDPKLLRAFLSGLEKIKKQGEDFCFENIKMRGENISLGSIVNKDVFCQKGMLILAKDTHINANTIDRIKLFEKNNNESLIIHIKKMVVKQELT